MRIAVVTACFSPMRGGIQTYADALAAALTRHGCVAVVTDDWQSPPCARPYAHFPITSLGAVRTSRDRKIAEAALTSCLMRFGPDVIHLADANMAVYAPVLAGIAPLVASVHGNDVTRPWQLWPEPISIAVYNGLILCRVVFVLSEHVKMLLRSHGLCCTVEKTPAGCDLSVFRPLPVDRRRVLSELGLRPQACTVITCARIVKRKGLDDLRRALLRTRLRVNWILVGDGSRRRRLKLALMRCIGPDRVRMVNLQNVQTSRLVELLNAADLFAMIPRQVHDQHGIDSEGFGLSYLEANACGRPALASAGSGCVEAVRDGVNGWIAPAGDVDGIAAALTTILSDRAAMEERGASALEAVRELRGWNRAADAVASTYRRVLKARAL